MKNINTYVLYISALIITGAIITQQYLLHITQNHAQINKDNQREMKITYIESPNYNQRRLNYINTIIIHYTATENLQETFDKFLDPKAKVSSHYLIDQDGKIYQLVNEKNRAWHAGRASWQGEKDINSFSIGIEIQNAGWKQQNKQNIIWEPFPDIQISQLIKLCRKIVKKYNIHPKKILAHSDVAPLRKQDPGNKFNWKKLGNEKIAQWEQALPPQPIRENTPKYGQKSHNIKNIQKKLQKYGYDINTDGHYNEWTRKVVLAFQRHFRQERVDGIADESTLNILEKLIQ